MSTDLITKFFQGWLISKSFNNEGHWQRWRSTAYNAEFEGCTIAVFKIPEQGANDTIRDIEELLQEKFIK